MNRGGRGDQLQLELLGRIASQHGLRGDITVRLGFERLASAVGTPHFADEYASLKVYIMSHRGDGSSSPASHMSSGKSDPGTPDSNASGSSAPATSDAHNDELTSLSWLSSMTMPLSSIEGDENAVPNPMLPPPLSPALSPMATQAGSASMPGTPLMAAARVQVPLASPKRFASPALPKRSLSFSAGTAPLSSAVPKLLPTLERQDSTGGMVGESQSQAETKASTATPSRRRTPRRQSSAPAGTESDNAAPATPTRRRGSKTPSTATIKEVVSPPNDTATSTKSTATTPKRKRRTMKTDSSEAESSDEDRALLESVLGLSDTSSDASGDSNAKPPYSFACLIALAINSSASKKLTVSEIYEWIQDAFPYYRETTCAWKNSVRHNLSLNKCFKRVSEDSAKFSHWTIDPSYERVINQAIAKHRGTTSSNAPVQTGSRSPIKKKHTRRHTTGSVNLKNVRNLNKCMPFIGVDMSPVSRKSSAATKGSADGLGSCAVVSFAVCDPPFFSLDGDVDIATPPDLDHVVDACDVAMGMGGHELPHLGDPTGDEFLSQEFLKDLDVEDAVPDHLMDAITKDGVDLAHVAHPGAFLSASLDGTLISTFAHCGITENALAGQWDQHDLSLQY